MFDCTYLHIHSVAAFSYTFPSYGRLALPGRQPYEEEPQMTHRCYRTFQT